MRVVCQMLVHTSRALPVCVPCWRFSVSLQRPLLPSMRVQTRSPDRIQLPLAQQGNRRPHSMLWRIVSRLQQNSLPIHMFAESISLPGSFNFHMLSRALSRPCPGVRFLSSIKNSLQAPCL